MLIPAEIEAIDKALSPLDFLSGRDYLQAVYAHLKEMRRDYSYLEFANDLGFSRTNVIHLIIRGKRPLSKKAAVRIGEALRLGGKKFEYFMAMVANGIERDQHKRDGLLASMLKMRESAADSGQKRFQMEYLSEWYHPVIREMSFLPDFMSDGGWIADHITPRIRPEQARKSLILLERLGLLRFDEKLGKHVPVTQTLSSGDEVDSLAVIRYHHSMIDLGKESITAIDERERDIGAITICADAETAEQIKIEVQAFRKRMLALAERAPVSSRVYQMNIQYFPVTKPTGRADATHQGKKPVGEGK